MRYTSDPPYDPNWAIYDVSSRAYVNGNVFPSNLMSSVSSVANGKLFFHGAANNGVGMEIWNVKTLPSEFKKTPQEYVAARVRPKA